MSDQNAYFKSREFLGILHQYEAARHAGSSVYLEADDLTDIAEYYHSKGDIGRAEEAADYAVELFPGAAAPLVFKARKALLIDCDVKRADEIAEQIEDKTDLDYLYVKAEIMIVDGREEEADEYLRENVADMDEDDREDFYIDVANLFIDYQIDDKCREWLERSSETDSADYQELQGRLALYAGDFKKSERIFTDLINRDPFSGTMWNQLASSQFRNDNIQEAIQSSEYAMAIDPDDSDAVMTKAGCLFTLGNYEQALKYYERYTRLCPDDEYGALLRGITLFNLNRPQEALIHMKRAEKLASPESSYLLEIYQQIAFTESYLRHLAEALKYIDKAMQLPGTDRNELLVMQGHLQLENNDVDAAEKSYEQAIVLSNASPKIMLHIAISFYDNERPVSAYTILKTLLPEADAEWTEGYAYLAMCCHDLHKDDEFAAAVKQACQLNPTEAKAVMGSLFPAEMNPKDYYDYLIHNPI